MPEILLDAETYDNALDWKTVERLEPPFLRDFKNEEILTFLDTPLNISVPHHTQYVERAIRVSNEAGKRAASLEMREGMARAIFEDRKKRPKCETKKDFAESVS